MKPSPAQHLPSWQPRLRQPIRPFPSPRSWRRPKVVVNCIASSRICQRSNEMLRSCNERMYGCRWPLNVTDTPSRSFSHIPTRSSSQSSSVDPWTFQQDRKMPGEPRAPCLWPWTVVTTSSRTSRIWLQRFLSIGNTQDLTFPATERVESYELVFTAVSEIASRNGRPVALLPDLLPEGQHHPRSCHHRGDLALQCRQ